MTDTTDELPVDASGERVADGGTWLLDLVAAVDHLRRGARPGLTVWDAIGEAVRWIGPDTDVGDTGFDSSAVGVGRLLSGSDESDAGTIQTAVRRWVLTMAHRYNDGFHWPHPAPRRGFPPGLINAANDQTT